MTRPKDIKSVSELESARCLIAEGGMVIYDYGSFSFCKYIEGQSEGIIEVWKLLKTSQQKRLWVSEETFKQLGEAKAPHKEVGK